MSAGSIESGRHEDDVGRELSGDRHHYGSKCGEVFGVAQRRAETAGPGDVDVVAKASSSPAFGRASGAGEEVAVVVTVDGQVQDTGIVVEDLLRAVAMMDVLNLLNLLEKFLDF